MKDKVSVYTAPEYEQTDGPPPRYLIVGWRYEVVLNGKVQHVGGNFSTLKEAQDAGYEKARQLGLQ